MERKLASVQRINNIRPIEGADAIECVTVNGWDVVAKKGDFKVGDLCVYFEIDSFLPAEDPRYHFLSKQFTTWQGRLGARVKTIKLRGQISQGLVLPLKDFPEVQIDFDEEIDNSAYDPEFGYDAQQLMIGFDVTKLLKIEKWEAPIPAQLAGKIKGNFPHFLQKTDQERIQNLWGKLTARTTKRWDPDTQTLHDEPGEPYQGTFEVTQKLDGSSMTAYLFNGQFGICSRNLDLIETPDNAFWSVARRLKLEEALRYTAERVGFEKGVAIQGELIGPGVQGNPEQLKELDFYVFDVFDIDNQRYLSPWERQVLCGECLPGVKRVPIVDLAASLSWFETLDKLLAYADGASSVCPANTRREGLVFKSNQKDGLSFKVISNRFLLAEK